VAADDADAASSNSYFAGLIGEVMVVAGNAQYASPSFGSAVNDKIRLHPVHARLSAEAEDKDFLLERRSFWTS
jgi:hypothetical protein